MSTHRTISSRTRLVAAAVTLASAVAVTLVVTTGSGGASGGHRAVPAPAERHTFEAPRGPSDPVNPWTLNNPEFFSLLHPPATSAASTNDLVIPDAERARLVTLIEAGAPIEPPAPGPSSDLVMSDAERAQLLTLIEDGVPLTADPTGGR